jgi:hypothetical protein
MIYTALCVRFLMRAEQITWGREGGELALEISSFVGLCEISRADSCSTVQSHNLLEISSNLLGALRAAPVHKLESCRSKPNTNII